MKTFNFQIITKDYDLNEEKEYLENIAGVAVKSGADVLQLRNKKLPAKNIYNSALFIKKLIKKITDALKSDNKPALIINDRPDIAYLAGADGVHVGQEDFPPADVKKFFPKLILGVSVQNAVQAVLAQRGGADYIGAGPAYPTASKADAGNQMQPENFKEICKTVDIPVIAIGGITESKVKKLAALGVSGVAIISAISNAKNPLNEALKFRKNIDKYTTLP